MCLCVYSLCSLFLVSVGLVIGRGGETIKAIQSMTGVYIQVHKEAPGERSNMRTITLKGSDAAIAAGEEEIHRVCAQSREAGGSGGGGGGGPGFGGGRPGLGYNSSGGSEETVQVPASMIGLVIGRGGESIRAIQDRTGAMVQVQKDDNPPDLRNVKLIGTPQAINEARRAIDDIIMSTREMQGGSFAGAGPPGGPPRQHAPGVPGMDGPPGAPGGGGGGPWRPNEGGGGFRGAPMSGPGMTNITVQVPNAIIGTIIGRGTIGAHTHRAHD